MTNALWELMIVTTMQNALTEREISLARVPKAFLEMELSAMASQIKKISAATIIIIIIFRY